MAGIGISVQFDEKLSALFEKAGAKSFLAVGRALDEIGNKTRTQVIKATAAQTGVKQARVRQVIRTKQALGAGAGEYKIIARNVVMSRKEFAPKQTPRGVSVTTAKRGRTCSRIPGLVRASTSSSVKAIRACRSRNYSRPRFRMKWSRVKPR